MQPSLVSRKLTVSYVTRRRFRLLVLKGGFDTHSVVLGRTLAYADTSYFLCQVLVLYHVSAACLFKRNMPKDTIKKLIVTNF